MPENFFSPETFVSVMTTCSMECSVEFHGPPLLDHPAQLCRHNSSPSRSASLTAKENISCHSGELNFTGPGGMPSLALKTCAPPIPTRCIDSRSAVMPSLVTLPFIQCHHVWGRADAGGD